MCYDAPCVIEIKNLSKHYGSRAALKSLSLTLEEGHTHAILGSSGCGKSTLLRLLLGVLSPSQGSISIHGAQVTPENQAQIASEIGYVVQEGGLFPHLTARENIVLKATLLGWKSEKTEPRIRELCDLVGLDLSLLDRYPKQLSGGQRQRVGLLRALFLNPPTLLLDEPLGALDPIIRYELQNELKKIFNQLKKTVIIVTHDLGEAAFFGHTITLLHEGELVQHGSFRELMESPKSPFVSQFFQSQRPAPELKDL